MIREWFLKSHYWNFSYLFFTMICTITMINTLFKKIIIINNNNNNNIILYRTLIIRKYKISIPLYHWILKICNIHYRLINIKLLLQWSKYSPFYLMRLIILFIFLVRINSFTLYTIYINLSITICCKYRIIRPITSC